MCVSVCFSKQAFLHLHRKLISYAEKIGASYIAKGIVNIMHQDKVNCLKNEHLGNMLYQAPIINDKEKPVLLCWCVIAQVMQ